MPMFTRRGALFIPLAPAIIGLAKPSVAQLLTTGAGPKPGGAPVVNATWDPTAKSSEIALTNSNVTAGSPGTNDGTWNTVLSNTGRSTGKRSFAIKITGGPAGASDIMPGFAAAKAGGVYTSTYLGSFALSVGFWNSGWLFGTSTTNGGVAQTTTYSAVGQYWQVEVDLDAGHGWCHMNGGSYVSGGNPSTDTAPSFTWTASTVMYPALAFLNDSSVNLVDILAGSAIPFTPSSGYTAWA